jgi:hypothetical protein
MKTKMNPKILKGQFLFISYAHLFPLNSHISPSNMEWMAQNFVPFFTFLQNIEGSFC